VGAPHPRAGGCRGLTSLGRWRAPARALGSVFSTRVGHATLRESDHGPGGACDRA
jgi:hypothetical protein